MAVQFIKTEAGEELAVLSRRDYDALLARAGDAAAEDRMSADIVRASEGETALPEAVWEKIEAGEHPIRAVREWRGLTQAELAQAAGIKQSYVSALEGRLKAGSTETLRRLASALRVTLDVLVADSMVAAMTSLAQAAGALITAAQAAHGEDAAGVEAVTPADD
ncbi:helix-turn-helix domain-containing protein [Phenylobacterium sp.]|uniref:helix-turn-helix domain-containing protein n=1 Tax=Phenylobacterium sp. TaxID=1871053 RepID=UPI0035B1FCB4